MKTFSRWHYNLSVCAAAAILAGCGGAAQFPNPAAQMPSGNTGTADLSVLPSIGRNNRLDSSSGRVERLRARGVLLGDCYGIPGAFNECNYRTIGIATGPFPGTFTAQMELFQNDQPLFWAFSESFTIGRNSKVTGTISVDGPGFGEVAVPGVYGYATTNGYSGKVKIQSLGRHFGPDADFLEIFHGM